ncbi:TolC family protein [Dokdonia sp.]|uniref:TolC family protein n=1 Tax=Dokdonia sp. TaxID=2024995 RepID=UPI0032636D3A
MKTQIIYSLLVILCSFITVGSAQESGTTGEQILTFEEYIGYVKKHHPLLKQAELVLKQGEANLLKARGGFDPKIEVDYARKQFKGIDYYDELNTTFKIPTWYGVEFKAGFEQNSGEFLNPRLNVPEEGLYSVGVSIALAQGFLINDRMATLRKAKFFKEQTKADRDLLVNNVLFEASKAYFEWLEYANAQRIYTAFLENATIRLKAVERSVAVGDKAAIDSVEAKITLQNRELNLEVVSLKRQKAALIVSNFLWLQDVPIELQDDIMPIIPQQQILKQSLQIDGTMQVDAFLETHPKLRSLDAKISNLIIDRSLKKNKLLPKINLEYNFISPEFNDLSGYNTQEYKAGLAFSYPIFTRKERGDVRLAEQKLQSTELDRISTSLTLKNKLSAVQTEITSLDKQNELIKRIVDDYKTLVSAEERKFFLGESSLFLINSREQKLINAELKENTLLIKQITAIANLYNVLGLGN